MGLTVNDLIKTQPITSSKNLIIRYGYIKTLEQVSKNHNYFYSCSTSVKEFIYNQEVFSDSTISSVICKSLVQFLFHYYTQNNINCKIEISKSPEQFPHYAIIVTRR